MILTIIYHTQQSVHFICLFSLAERKLSIYSLIATRFCLMMTISVCPLFDCLLFVCILLIRSVQQVLAHFILVIDHPNRVLSPGYQVALGQSLRNHQNRRPIRQVQLLRGREDWLLNYGHIFSLVQTRTTPQVTADDES